MPPTPSVYKIGYAQDWKAVWSDSTVEELRFIVEGKIWTPQQLRAVYLYPEEADTIRVDSFKITRFEIDITGVRENKDEIWIHPPRGSYYEVTEQASFPYVKFPVFKGQKYTHRRDIPPGNYEAVNLDGDSVLHFYEVYDFQLKRDGGFTDSTWLIKSYGLSRNGKAVHDFLFHPRLGFVRSNYTFPDGEKLILTLKSYEYMDYVSSYSLPEISVFFR
jgi:hypothetical protein